MTTAKNRIRAAVADERATDEPALVVDVEGFEGPLDLLLMLARQQKVDLAKISILALADQYPRLHRGGAQAAARARRRLSGDGGMARLSQIAAAAARTPTRRRARAPRTWRNALALRLRRLEAIRDVAEQLLARPQLDRDVFGRGAAGADRRNQEARNGRRRSTICSPPMRSSASTRRWRMCASPSARSGRWPKRARRWSG